MSMVDLDKLEALYGSVTLDDYSGASCKFARAIYRATPALIIELRDLRAERLARIDATPRYGCDRAPEELRAGPLGKYGVHLPTCDREQRTATTCPCGFVEALAEAVANAEEAKRIEGYMVHREDGPSR